MAQKSKISPEDRKTFGRGRFATSSYRLDFSKVHDLPLQINGTASTLIEVFNRLREAKAKLGEESVFGNKFESTDGSIALDGRIDQWPAKYVLKQLVGLMQLGLDPSNLRYYYYGHDWSIDGDETHNFFAVDGEKIVADDLGFGSECPWVLSVIEEKVHSWHNHPYFNEALNIYWYRRFYTESLIGKLMVLRTDEPILYFFERSPKSDVIPAVQLSLLAKMYRVVWVVASLIIGKLYPLAEIPMFIVAGMAGLDLLRIWWATRKLGD